MNVDLYNVYSWEREDNSSPEPDLYCAMGANSTEPSAD